MKHYCLSLLIIAQFPFGCLKGTHEKQTSRFATPLVYEIDLNSRADDRFKVKLLVNDLETQNSVYQFAATAPGTYQVMDIGRFVSDFEAYDDGGKTLKTRRISTNQWLIEDVERVREIRYCVAETWDTLLESHSVLPMCGTSIEEDHVQINSHCVLGYPAGMQNRGIRVKLFYPPDWQVGSALRRDHQGYYSAKGYDHIVDSPFLLGRLSRASVQVDGTKIETYTYSKSDTIASQKILESIKSILHAASQFMNGLPVEQYTFLFHFEDERPPGAGAWEHSYSSTYSFPETGFSRRLQNSLPGTIAHEFFHILTPLNIHSELIEHFDFVEPVPSEHLWLYEGVTEWAAQIMMLRAGLIDLHRYLQILSRKLRIDDLFDKTYSLRDLALTPYTENGQQQYPNIYHRGALVAGLLDIRLLELSSGKRGLREVMNELAAQYGPANPFPEKAFYSLFIGNTYPEVGEFLDRYVKQTEPLPIAEYFGKLGIHYEKIASTGEKKPTLGMRFRLKDGEINLFDIAPQIQQNGVREGDILLAVNSEAITDLDVLQRVQRRLRELEIGDSYELTIKRDGKEFTSIAEIILLEKVERHLLEVNEAPTGKQLALRESWQQNLPLEMEVRLHGSR